MNLKTLIVVVLRLLAINLAIQTLAAMAPFGLLAYQQRGELVAFSVVVTVCLLTFALLMWYFAPSVANFVSSGRLRKSPSACCP